MTRPPVRVVPADELGAVAAGVVAARLEAALAERPTAVLALSGGRGPIPMFRALSSAGVAWERIHLAQVDERVVPDDHDARNLGLIRRELVERIDGPAPAMHPMPVTAPDLDAAAARYAAELEELAGRPPVLDVVHLGIGEDGHTASLFPGDDTLEERARWVVATGERAGYRRMTMTLPVLDRARAVVLVVSGASKAPALRRLLEGDREAPVSRVRAADLVVVADEAAAGASGSR